MKLKKLKFPNIYKLPNISENILKIAFCFEKYYLSTND